LQFGVAFGGLERCNVRKNAAQAWRTTCITFAKVPLRRKPINFSVGSENAKLEFDRSPEPHSRTHDLSHAGAIFRMNAIEQCFQCELCVGGKAEQGPTVIGSPKGPIRRVDLPEAGACGCGGKCHPLFAFLK